MSSDTLHFIEHHTHYYPEGNVIILAGQTKFRVFQSALERKSIVFKDMFDTTMSGSGTNPSQCGGQIIVDGIAAVELQDSEEDVAHLLDAIFPSSMFVPRPSNKVLHTIIRLADKYQFDELCKETAAAALQPFPRTLDDFQGDPDLTCYNSVVKVAEAIHLAQIVGDSAIFPLAFYALMVRDWPVDDPVASGELNGTLTFADHIRLQNGRSALMHAMTGGLARVNRRYKCGLIEFPGVGNVACPLDDEPLIRRVDWFAFTQNPLGEVWKRSVSQAYCAPCQRVFAHEMPTVLCALFDVLQAHFAKS